MTIRELKPLPLSDDDLDELAAVTDQDIIDANEAWRRHSKPADKDLLQAEDAD